MLLCTKSRHPKKEPVKNIVAPEDRIKFLATKTSVEFPTKLSSPSSYPSPCTKDEAIINSNFDKPVKGVNKEDGMFWSGKLFTEFLQRAAVSQDDRSAIPVMTGNKSSEKHTEGEEKERESSSSSSDSDSESDSEETTGTIEISIKKTKVQFPVREPFISLKSSNKTKELAMSAVDEDLEILETQESYPATHKTAPGDGEIMKPGSLSRQKEVPPQMEGKEKLMDETAMQSVVAALVTQVPSSAFMGKKETKLLKDIPEADGRKGNRYLFVCEENSFEDSTLIITPETTRDISWGAVTLRDATEETAGQKENNIRQTAAVEMNTRGPLESSTLLRKSLGVTESLAVEMNAFGTTEGSIIKREALSTTESTIAQMEEHSTIQESEVAAQSAVEESDHSTYKNLQHHSYTLYTFVDFDVQLEKHRQPQPSSGRLSPRH